MEDKKPKVSRFKGVKMIKKSFVLSIPKLKTTGAIIMVIGLFLGVFSEYPIFNSIFSMVLFFCAIFFLIVGGIFLSMGARAETKREKIRLNKSKDEEREEDSLIINSTIYKDHIQKLNQFYEENPSFISSRKKEFINNLYLGNINWENKNYGVSLKHFKRCSEIKSIFTSVYNGQKKVFLNEKEVVPREFINIYELHNVAEKINDLENFSHYNIFIDSLFSYSRRKSYNSAFNSYIKAENHKKKIWRKLYLLDKKKENEIKLAFTVVVLNLTAKIKKTVLNLSTKFTRLEIREIAEKCNLDNEDLIIEVVRKMINNKEIYAEYFRSSNSILFNQQANIEEIDRLMATYKEWEEKGIGKK